jgi:hypothetical protein
VPDVTVTNGTDLGTSGDDNAYLNPATFFNIESGSQLLFNGSIHLFSGASASIYNGSTSFNGSAITVDSGATFYLYGAPISFNGSSLTLASNAAWVSYYTSGIDTINNAVTLNGVAHMILGDHDMVYPQVISGAGGFVFDYYNNEMVLEGANTYTGPTIIGSSDCGGRSLATGHQQRRGNGGRLYFQRHKWPGRRRLLRDDDDKLLSVLRNQRLSTELRK